MQLKHLPFLFALLVCFALSAQVLSPVARRAIVLSGIANSTTFPDELWWIFSDMATNINVTNWVEGHYSASFWTNGTTGSTRPTNNALGLHFDGSNSQQLTNANLTFGTSSTHFVILRREGTGNFQALLSKANDGTLEWGRDTVAAQTKWRLTLNAADKAIDGDPVSSSFFDIALVSDGSGTTVVGYTNGVPYATNTTTSFTGPWRFLGGIPTDGFFTGWIKEQWIRTNTAETAVQIAARHTAATNKYGYSP